MMPRTRLQVTASPTASPIRGGANRLPEKIGSGKSRVSDCGFLKGRVSPNRTSGGCEDLSWNLGLIGSLICCTIWDFSMTPHLSQVTRGHSRWTFQWPMLLAPRLPAPKSPIQVSGSCHLTTGSTVMGQLVPWWTVAFRTTSITKTPPWATYGQTSIDTIDTRHLWGCTSMLCGSRIHRNWTPWMSSSRTWQSEKMCTSSPCIRWYNGCAGPLLSKVCRIFNLGGHLVPDHYISGAATILGPHHGFPKKDKEEITNIKSYLPLYGLLEQWTMEKKHI